MTIINAEGEFLERQAVEALPVLEKQIYQDMIQAEIYSKHKEKAITIVARKHGMTEEEVTKYMLWSIDFIDDYIETHRK